MYVYYDFVSLCLHCYERGNWKKINYPKSKMLKLFYVPQSLNVVPLIINYSKAAEQSNIHITEIAVLVT